jgi:hypothetical protein
VLLLLLLLLLLQVADRGGLPAAAAAAAAGAAGPVPEGEADTMAMGEDLGEFWCRTGGTVVLCLGPCKTSPISGS